MAQWTPEELAQLPEDSRPGTVLNTELISQWAVHLTRRDLKFDGNARSADLLHELASVFVQASNRLAQHAEARVAGPSSDILPNARD
jgi:hypothetical protein